MTRPLRVALLTSARTWRGSGVSRASVAEGLREHGHAPHMLAGDAEVVDAFTALGLPSGRVPTGNTGLREAGALAQTLRRIGADAVLVDRPRDLRLASLASLLYPVAMSLALTYFAEHYVVDAICGAAVALLVMGGVGRWERRRAA